MNKEKLTRAWRMFGYFVSMGICAFFALYMSAEIGWVFFYIFAAALVFSLAITFGMYRSGCVEIQADISDSMVYKGEIVKLKFSVRNRSIFPVPAVRIKLRECDSLESDENTNLYTVSVSPRSSTEFEILFKAKMWGGAVIGAENIAMVDFLNFLNISMYKETGLNTYSKTIRVFPNIPDIPADTPLVKNTCETIRFSDEVEDTKETDKANFFGGMPGYTHREYAEGDPIKRINWKLSSRRDIYMVRLDDEIEAMQQVIVLDSMGSERALDERAVEGMLAVTASLVKLGFESTVWINGKNGFESYDISEYGDVQMLQTVLAKYDFCHENKKVLRIPTEDMQSKKTSSGFMLFTSLADAALSAEIFSAETGGVNVTPVIAGKNICVNEPYWIINEDYTAVLQ